MPIPMTPPEVEELMKSAKSAREWNDFCDKVVASHGGKYPEWWHWLIIQRGVLEQKVKEWNKPTPTARSEKGHKNIARKDGPSD